MYFVGPDNGLLVAAAEAAGEAPVTRVVELAARPGAARPRRHLRRARPLRAGGGRAVHGHAARAAGGADRPGVAGAPDRRRGRAGPAARRAHLPAGRGHLGRPLRQPAAGGDRGRRPGGRDPRGGEHRAGGPHRVRAASTSTGCRTRSSPTACSCAASTPSASWSRGSSGSWSTPTGIWPWWPARRRPRTGSTSSRGSCWSWPGEAGVAAVWCRRRAVLGTIRRSERRANRRAEPSAAAPPKRIPEATVLRLPVYQRILAELVRGGRPDGLVRAAGRAGPGQRGQGAQGPLAAGLVRHPRLGLRPRVPDRADRPRARRRRELVGGHRRHRQPRPRPHQLGRRSPRGAARSPRSSTSTRPSSARRSAA